MTEIWQTIPSFPTHEASNLGRIRRATSSRGWRAHHVLTLTPEPKGYLRVGVSISNRRRVIRAHIAVLEAFIGPRPPKHDASHINGDRSDNRLENLAWETSSENHQRKLAHGTLVHGEKHKCAKLTIEQVREIRARSGERVRDIGAQYGVSGTLVSRIQRGLAWPHAA